MTLLHFLTIAFMASAIGLALWSIARDITALIRRL
jgi:hypothetical protein